MMTYLADTDVKIFIIIISLFIICLMIYTYIDSSTKKGLINLDYSNGIEYSKTIDRECVYLFEHENKIKNDFINDHVRQIEYKYGDDYPFDKYGVNIIKSAENYCANRVTGKIVNGETFKMLRVNIKPDILKYKIMQNNDVFVDSINLFGYLKGLIIAFGHLENDNFILHKVIQVSNNNYYNEIVLEKKQIYNMIMFNEKICNIDNITLYVDPIITRYDQE